METGTKTGIAIGGLVTALITLYQFLPTFGIVVPTLPEGFGPAFGTVIGFFVGLFTKNPTVLKNAEQEVRE